jgi:deoxyribonuclease IV
MKILLGPAGIPMSCKHGSSIEGIKRISELGLGTMETPFTHGIHMSLETAKRIGVVAKDLGIELSIHAPYFINLASESEKIIEDSKMRILDSLQRGVAMNATVIVAHAGYYGKDKEKSNQMVLDACSEIEGKIEENGWDIELGLETMGRQKSWGRIEEIVEVCRKMRHVIPYLDVAHIYALNGGQVDYGRVFDALETLKLKKYHCHFSGIKYNLVGIGRGNEISHVPMEEAGPDFRGLANEILRRKLDISIISESPLLEMDSLLMKSIFEELGYTF